MVQEARTKLGPWAGLGFIVPTHVRHASRLQHGLKRGTWNSQVAVMMVVPNMLGLIKGCCDGRYRYLREVWIFST